MHLRHILAAADDSEEGRAAIAAAARLAAAAGARLTVLTVIESDELPPIVQRHAERLRRLTETVVAGISPPPQVEHALASGLPGIEIGRFAEERGTDLIVLGRKRRTHRQRLLIGDTADAVVRRSALPCLFVPGERATLTAVLAALDGTERGIAVLSAAAEFAREIGGSLRAVTVEPAYENEIGVTRVPTGRSARLVQAIRELEHAPVAPERGRGRQLTVDRESPLVIHRGAVVEEIIGEIEARGADVLVVGYHRGGPAGVIEPRDVSRRLTHEAPCAVLTIPL